MRPNSVIQIQNAAEFRNALTHIRMRLQSRVEQTKLRQFVLLDFKHAKESTSLGALPPSSLGQKPAGVNLYGDLPESELARNGPRLIEIPDNEAAIEAICAHAINDESASFILAGCTLDMLATHLQALREVMLPDGGAALFRFQDVHVTSALWPLLDTRRANRVLGPAMAWLVRDACGELICLEHPVGSTRQTTNKTFSIDRTMLATLNEALLPWTVAEQIDEIDSSLLHGLRACGRRTLVRERLARGRGQGLSQTDDLALYCALSLQLPDGFEKIEPFAKALAATRAGSRRFGEYLDKIPAEQWDVTDKLLNTL